MKRLILFLVVVTYSLVNLANGGLPFFVNYTSDVYNAHNRNFDIECDDYGTVFVANFEGVLYYDQAQWRIIHTPGISRVTSLFKDGKGRIWVGGYNVFGYLTASSNGELKLRTLYSDTNKTILGEISKIEEHSGEITFQTSKGLSYKVSGNKIRRIKTAVSKIHETIKNTFGYKVNQSLYLDNGWNLLSTAGNGLIIDECNGRGMYSMSETNGLCSNNVNYVTSDGKGAIWGATDKGLFCVSMPSVFTDFTSAEGLKGEVISINSQDGKLYVGTMQGLFVKKERNFVPVTGITQACWQLQKSADGSLYAATSDGLFIISNGSVSRINKAYTLSVLSDVNGRCYTGELDGIYLNTQSGKRKKISGIEKVKQISHYADGAVLAETVYGEQYIKYKGTDKFVDLTVNSKKKQEEDTQRPQFAYKDKDGKTWQTNIDGRSLCVMRNGKHITEYDSWLNPLRNLTISAMNVSAGDVWIGGDFGLIHWTSDKSDVEYNKKSNLYIRSIVLNGDSIIWGGYNMDNNLKPEIPETEMKFGSDNRSISFTFSTDHASIFGKTEYRYRLVGYNDWSAWSTNTSASFENLWYGGYKFQVMARDKYGRISQPVTFDFSIHFPIYLKWYSVIVYILLLLLFVMAMVRHRMRNLLKDKIHLEKIVEERTSELRQRNEEVEEKSKSLEKALDDLGNAQNELIHQEKMATVGKLTKGLIDRILNPMNYINNFSHLSKGLIKDVKENIDDDKEKMTPDIYDDTIDVLSMVDSNLEKIEQHGMNTTRILKAMEEMLRERKGKIEPIVVSSMCSRILEITSTYHADLIKKYGIRLRLDNCPDTVIIEANAEQLHKTLMSFADNSMYAVAKKYEHKPYEPDMRLTVETKDDTVKIHLYDNGIGIEKTIIDNIFDPFFTTKTTGEAAGVGLYLSKEIISNFGGTISVQSKKDEYTEFIITLPLKHD